MTRFVIYALGTLWLGSCFMSEHAGTWTVMTWNVENLFDGYSDGGEYREFDPLRGDWDERLFQRRVERTLEVILQSHDSKPDIVALQELENLRVFTTLMSSGLKQAGYRWGAFYPSGASVGCGILSLVPIERVVVIESGDWEGRSLRPMLACEMQFQGQSLWVVNGHWKSPWNGRKETEGARIQEAQALLRMLQTLQRISPGSGIVIAGDLNTPGDGALNPSALGPLGSAAVMETTANPILAQQESLFYDPSPQGHPPGTYWFQGKWGRPDRFLLAPSGLLKTGWFVEQCRVVAHPQQLTAQGYPKRWNEKQEEGYSDHLPLWLWISLPLETNVAR
ncbi:MAG: endonuclease/exonuclease/phosphatase family protein [Spirochaetales bacterium]|nr:endonuclease/exonuclease/phosphatase family protein [Spirochaetales bacterium]